MKKPLLTLLASTLVAVGCASQPAAAEQVSPGAVAAAISAAEHSAAQAAAVHNEWRDTGKFIKEAKAAAEAKDYAKALKLANKADQQGQLAVAQHARELKYVEHHRMM